MNNEKAASVGCIGCLSIPLAIVGIPFLLFLVCGPSHQELVDQQQQEKATKQATIDADRKAHPKYWHYRDIWGAPPDADSVREYLHQVTEVYDGHSAFPQTIDNELKIHHCSKSYIGKDGYLIHARYYAIGGNNVSAPGENDNWFTFKKGKVIAVEDGSAHPELE
jgi:hypothetical protein